MEDLISMLHELHRHDCYVDARHVDDPYNAHHVLRQMDGADPRPSAEKRVIVDIASPQAAQAILRQVYMAYYTTTPYRTLSSSCFSAGNFVSF